MKMKGEWRARLYLILNEEFDTLDGSSGGLGDGSRDTTHQEIDGEVCQIILLVFAHGGRRLCVG